MMLMMMMMMITSRIPQWNANIRVGWGSHCFRYIAQTPIVTVTARCHCLCRVVLSLCSVLSCSRDRYCH
uniref:Putative secreted protein n=1 Tax=Anopheles triannulatus TaxID=58253 RepID=A0A2M4B2Z1_9DIPT